MFNPIERLDCVAACIRAVRTDEVIGRGTCTDIDETYSDEELFNDFILESLSEGRCISPKKLVRDLRRLQKARDSYRQDIENA